MLTPGAAGGVVSTIAIVVAPVVGIDPIKAAMGLSFLSGLLVLATHTAWWKRLIYYFLNSLIISSVALGAVGAKNGFNTGPQPPEQAIRNAGAPPPPGISVSSTRLPAGILPGEAGK
jgi:hypothetical protein